MKKIVIEATYQTGYKLGYIKVADRHEGELIPLPAIEGLRGELRKVVKLFSEKGCTHYTKEYCQAVNSKRYFYIIYQGYTVTA